MDPMDYVAIVHSDYHCLSEINLVSDINNTYVRCSNNWTASTESTSSTLLPFTGFLRTHLEVFKNCN
jgi:hypothetical protein